MSKWPIRRRVLFLKQGTGVCGRPTIVVHAPVHRAIRMIKGHAAMNAVRSMVGGAALLMLPTQAQDHRFETDPVATVREDFVACDVLSQLQRVMDNRHFLLAGECEPLPAGHQVRIKPRAGRHDHAMQMDTVLSK
jgi:hypothetical protein